MATTTANSIELPRGGDWQVPFGIRDRKTKEQYDLSSANLTLEVKGKFVLVPAIHPTDPKKRMFVFNEEHARLVGSDARQFQVVWTQGSYSRVVWEGTIKATGFARTGAAA